MFCEQRVYALKHPMRLLWHTITDLLGVCVGKGQTIVVLLQQVEVLTHHVHQGLSFGVFLQRHTVHDTAVVKRSKTMQKKAEERFSLIVLKYHMRIRAYDWYSSVL